MERTGTSPEVLVTYITLYHLNLRLLFLIEKQAKEISKTTCAIAILIQAVSQLLSGFAELHLRT
jgi:hypothetical protein